MTNFDHDDLPPDLADLGRRMRDERPVAEDAALDRMMQRAQTSGARTPGRTPRRAFAVSLASMIAMVSVTGVAAASLFGMNFSHVGKALTSSSSKVGTASSQALKASAAPAAAPAARATSSQSTRPATFGSTAGALASLGGNSPAVGASSTGAASGVSANLIPGNLFNAGFFQYGPGRFVCRILRALRLNFIANLLGCPPS